MQLSVWRSNYAHGISNAIMTDSLSDFHIAMAAAGMHSTIMKKYAMNLDIMIDVDGPFLYLFAASPELYELACESYANSLVKKKDFHKVFTSVDMLPIDKKTY